MHVLAAGSAVDPALSNLSDNLVLGMILVYAVALFLFVFEAAYGRRQSLTGTRLVAVGASEAENSDLKVSLREQEPEAKASRHVVGKIGMAVTAVGLLLNLAQIVTRGLAVGRWPWGNMFEFVIAICLCGVAAFLFAAMRYRAHYLGAFVLVPVLLLLGIAVRWLYSESGPVVPALDSYWIAIHVSALILATGAFMVSGSATITYLLARRTEVKQALGQQVSAIAAKLPSAELLDRIAHRMIVLAFPLWTFGVIAGAIWADEAWGRYWGWDPKEVWSFITWIVYAAYLHARATAGWQGPKAAWISLIGFGCLLFNFFGVNYLFSGLHSYA
ncbi:CcsB [Thermobifida fusca TM51]|uniref:CcsB n=2 Tax=Thermobifida fusca TaxID=2021 RepID=A0A9P2T7C1_THEFU|nr:MULTISPECIES: c-type cytochrome biogenesis protein CcsB [Thermobifida]EOR70166.1 CcsB [Thermobifida fusca TM51]MBO2528951.1 c-type cytochrome biogenesis protein CcsB [Thermobifida sp.]MDD6792943.1 c-type cytochrome biogenesis protein CcsB [Thermobifida fusca]PPS95284.1 cytochrome C biogenesis protein [Thermobifida fusca]PZN66937.1 MAG: c-type cytochrome biogenesis protein CcsB [Thermobifida fusca]